MTLRDFVFRFRRISLVLAAALAAAATASAQDAAGGMPEDYLPELKLLLRAALKQSPTMIQSQLTIAGDEAQVIVSDAAMLPHLSAYGSYTVTREQIAEETGSSGNLQSIASPASTGKGFFYGASASETLFQWGQLFNRSRYNRIGVAIARRQYDEAYDALAIQIREGFLGLILGKMSLRNARYDEGLANAALSLAREQAKNGELSPSAIASQELQTDQARLAADRAAEAYVHARHALAALAGLSEISDEGIPADVPKPAFSPPAAEELLAAFLRDDAKSTFQAQVYQMQIEQAKLTYKIARVNLLPTLSAGAGYSLSSQNSITGPATSGGQAQVSVVGIKSLNYGLNASWNIFDGLSTRGQKRAALATERSDERTLETYLDSTLEAAQDGEKQLEFAARAMDLSERQLSWTEGGLKRTEEDLKAGLVGRSAVEGLRSVTYSQEYGTAAARADFFNHWAEFVSLVGADPAMQSLPISHVHSAR